MKIVEVFEAQSDGTAHLVKALLDDAGIQARIVGEMLKGVAGELPLGQTIAPRVWVFENDAPRAREIIAEWEKRYLADRARQAAPWQCSQCSAEVEGSFDICWKCQAPRPETGGSA